MPYSDKEKQKAWNKAYEKVRKRKCRRAYQEAYQKAYRDAHKRKTRRVVSKEEQAERRKIYAKNYRKANPEKARLHSRKRRALKLGNGHETYTEGYIFERDGWICGICGRKINKRLKYPDPYSKSIDHIIPVIRGGADAPINIQAAHLRCNMSKNAGCGGQLRLIG